VECLSTNSTIHLGVCSGCWRTPRLVSRDWNLGHFSFPDKHFHHLLLKSPSFLALSFYPQSISRASGFSAKFDPVSAFPLSLSLSRSLFLSLSLSLSLPLSPPPLGDTPSFFCVYFAISGMVTFVAKRIDSFSLPKVDKDLLICKSTCMGYIIYRYTWPGVAHACRLPRDTYIVDGHVAARVEYQMYAEGIQRFGTCIVTLFGWLLELT
jgi:hypothetical protein